MAPTKKKTKAPKRSKTALRAIRRNNLKKARAARFGNMRGARRSPSVSDDSRVSIDSFVSGGADEPVMPLVQHDLVERERPVTSSEVPGAPDITVSAPSVDNGVQTPVSVPDPLLMPAITPSTQRSARPPIGAPRHTPCLGCVRSMLAGRLRVPCSHTLMGRGARCWLCSSGHSCQDL
ncbi:hypothetical protein M434DRAFT_262220 [Hypoxylon sp. CO27-5]|nr:hypothetical protein M434DRAFT_262220 [Hypoxylon sp. CO27-5]